MHKDTYRSTKLFQYQQTLKWLNRQATNTKDNQDYTIIHLGKREESGWVTLTPMFNKKMVQVELTYFTSLLHKHLVLQMYCYIVAILFLCRALSIDCILNFSGNMPRFHITTTGL
jgi:hypothetical protein